MRSRGKDELAVCGLYQERDHKKKLEIRELASLKCFPSIKIDDSEDADILDSLLDPFPPPMVQVFSTEEMMGVATGHVVRRCQTFSQASFKISQLARPHSTAK